MPCSVQQPMEDFILQQSPSPHVQELCWRIQSKTPWCLPPQTASRPKTLPKKKLQSQVAMPCPDINHMRHASISHHVSRDDHVGRIHLFLLASRKGEVATVPSNVGTTSLCPLFPSSFGFFVFLSPEPPEIPHDSGELPWPCAEQSNHSRYQPPECFHLSEEEGGKRSRSTTPPFFKVENQMQSDKKDMNRCNFKNCLYTRVTRSLGITCQFKAYPHPTKALWHAEISTVLHCSSSCPGHVSSLAPTWRTSFHCLPQHGGFMTPGHLVDPGKAEGKEVNGVNHLGYEDAKVWRIGSTPPPEATNEWNPKLGGHFLLFTERGGIFRFQPFFFSGIQTS